MRYAYFGFGMLLFGSIGVVIIMMFESITLDNDSEYYVLKEAQEAAMLESVDLACYRSSDVVRNDDNSPKRDADGNYTYVGCNGDRLKISEQKFVENFTRRFSQTISGNVDSYTLDFYDIIESPPKATVVVTSHNKSYSLVFKSDDLNITNNLSGILEMVD